MMPVRLLLQRGWSRTAKRTWPVVYLLHGGSENYKSWTKNTDVEKLSSRHGVIVVMPEGGSNGGYTDWLVGPQWETFHLTELRRLLETKYRAGRRRAVAGLSTGGYGALIYAARHRGMFEFAGSYSGFASTLTAGVPEVLLTGLPGKDLEKFLMWGNPVINSKIWKQHDPVHQAHRLRGTRLYVSCPRNGVKGPLDPPTAQAVDPAEAFVYYTVKPFLKRLRELKIPVTTHLYDKGTHSWVYWERELKRSWPMMMRAIKAS
jgi:S-formylglutathione hydrolase FrmB